MIVVLPFSQYLDERFVHVRVLSTMRILLLITLVYLGLRLRHEPLDKRIARMVVPPALALCLYLMAVAVQEQSFTTNIGLVIDVTLLPVLLFLQIWRTGLVERASSSVAWAASFVLVFEVCVGLKEFLTNQYFFTFADEKYVLVYGSEGSLGVGVRATGTFMHPEEYALICGLLGLYLMLYWRERQRPLLVAVTSSLALVACGLSGLRGSLLPLVFLMIGVYLKRGPKFAGRFVTISAVTSVFMVVLNAIFHPLSNSVIQDRLSNSDNIYGRIAAYKSAIAIFFDHPVFGVGYGQYTRVALDSRYDSQFAGVNSVPFPHNTFLAVLAETGVIGLGLYLWLWIAILRVTRSGVDHHAHPSAWPLILLFVLSGLSLNLGGEPVSVAGTLILAGAVASLVGNRLGPADDLAHFNRTRGGTASWTTSVVQKSG
jgi:O-antigen ligase